MVKPAGYFISAVQYDVEHKYIVNAKRHLDRGGYVARGNIVNRSIIADDLKKGLNYQTIYRDENNKWKIGEEIKINLDTGFITTTTAGLSDNLGKLPEFFE